MVKKQFKAQSQVFGFSLVELMVTVGIIGVLASVAVPQYSKFTAKSKQSEAKVQLGAIFTVEKAFYIEAQNYSSCLSGIGYGVEGNERRYSVGFGTTEQASPENSTLICKSNSAKPVDGVHFFQPSPRYNKAYSDAPPNTSVTKSSQGSAQGDVGGNFVAGAKGSIQGSGLDAWTINERQDLRNTEQGI
jgi:type IV pilus assembly protein PilA